MVIARYQNRLSSFLREENQFSLSITIFCKSLYAFLFLKIIFLWPILSDVQRYSPYEFSSALHTVIYAPVFIAQYNLNAFLIPFLVVVGIALIIRINYFTAALVFWLSFSLSRFAFSIGNGSDYVLNLFLFISIFLPVVPAMKSVEWQKRQFVISNYAFLFCRIQFSLIYILSGFDKLTGHAWRTGDAVYSIVNLEYFMNPGLSIPFNKNLFALLAWMIILFELGFPILIWFKRFRLYALAIGIVFHLAIIFVLNLPDFGLVMILTYSLFIPYEKWKGRNSPNG